MQSSKRKWTDQQLNNAVKTSRSIRQVIHKLGLIEAGGNYVQIPAHIKRLNLSTSHFTGESWNKGLSYTTKRLPPLSSLVINGSEVQSYKLKKRLLDEQILEQQCCMCGWAKQSIDGRIPLELDHINGNRTDNRLENLRILCPNCHSLQPTHRGKNKKKS